jgi:hypothetical protein
VQNARWRELKTAGKQEMGIQTCSSSLKVPAKSLGFKKRTGLPVVPQFEFFWCLTLARALPISPLCLAQSKEIFGLKEEKPKPKRHMNTDARRALSAAAIAVFTKQYGRKARMIGIMIVSSRSA